MARILSGFRISDLKTHHEYCVPYMKTFAVFAPLRENPEIT